MFCRIYVTGENLNRQSLLMSICGLVKAKLVDNAYIEKEGYSLEVRANDEYDELREKVFPDGFLYFPFSIEVDIEDDVSREGAAKEISEILKFLWTSNYTAIASCEFENLLPEGGGYKSRNIPWVR